MSLSFRITMDRHSLDVHRENPANRDGIIDGSTRIVGSLQWHGERTPRLIPQDSEPFSLSELETIVAKLKAASRSKL